MNLCDYLQYSILFLSFDSVENLNSYEIYLFILELWFTNQKNLLKQRFK